MEIVTKNQESCTVVELRGRLNTTNFSELEGEFSKLIEAGRYKILVDCAQLDYVSSSGLRVFLVALKTLKKLNGTFVLCNLKDTILEVFEVSGFITIFTVCESRDEALKAFIAS